MSLSRNNLAQLNYMDDDECLELYSESVELITEDDFPDEREEVAAEVRAVITADTFKQAIYLADDKFSWGNGEDCARKLWEAVGRDTVPKMTHEQITQVAECLADELAKDREELINFVYEALKRGYDEDPDSFSEDWETYVAG